MQCKGLLPGKPSRGRPWFFSAFSWPNDEHVHPLPAAAEDELGVEVQTMIDVANTTAGSGLHDASCSSVMLHWVILCCR